MNLVPRHPRSSGEHNADVASTRIHQVHDAVWNTDIADGDYSS